MNPDYSLGFRNLKQLTSQDHAILKYDEMRMFHNASEGVNRGRNDFNDYDLKENS